MHLMGHAHSDSHAFITLNAKHFIKGGRQASLKNDFGILVLTPEEAVQRLSAEFGWNSD